MLFKSMGSFIILILLVFSFEVSESKNVSRVTLLVNRTDSTSVTMELCADLLTSFVFPDQRDRAFSHILVDLTAVNSSLETIIPLIKEIKSSGQRIACLVRKNMLNQVLYYLNPDLFVVNIPDTDPEAYLMDKMLRNGSSIVRLTEVQFQRLSKSITPEAVSHMRLYAYQQAVTSISVARLFFARLIVYVFGVVALISGCALVVLRQEVLAKQIIVYQALYGNTFHFYLMLLFLVVQAFALVLLTFYYARFMVKVAIVGFYLLGVASIVYVGRCIFSARFERKWSLFTLKIHGEPREVKLSLMMSILLPLAFALTTFWLWFSSNYMIGFILQCVIAMFIVQFLLSFVILLRSLKKITVFCLMVMPLEVVLEVIFPRLGVANGKPLLASMLTDEFGYLGQPLPGAFLINLRQYSGSQYHYCSYVDYMGFLSLGHVAIPGLICALLMLHDCQQQVRFRRNVVSSILGYCLGLVVTYIVERRLGYAQPALLFLVPCTLICPIIVSFLCTRAYELERIWQGTFIDEDNDLDELSEKHLSHVSTLSVFKDNTSVDLE